MLGIVVMVQKYHFCKDAFIMKEKLQTKFCHPAVHDFGYV